MKLQAMALTLAALILAGCDAGAAGGGSSGKTVFPDDLPKIPAGIFRVTSMKNTTLIGKGADSCLPERTVQEMMSYDFGAKSCTDETFEVLSDGWKHQARCQHRYGPMTVTANLTGGLRSSFTVEKTRVYDTPRDGRTSDTFTHRWEYRGQCQAKQQN